MRRILMLLATAALGAVTGGAVAAQPLRPSPVATAASASPRPTGDPEGRATQRRHAVVTSGPSDKMRIALTLDDGFNPDPRVLDLTESLGVSGTAFLTGEAALANPWLVERLVRGGWEVCSHTWSHRVLTRLPPAQVEDEIVRGLRTLAEMSGQSCRWFRPPAGAVNATVQRVVAALGLTVVNWNASISDSTSSSTPVSVQVDIARSGIAPGAILLGHFGGVHSHAVLSRVLPETLANGYEIVSVTRLLEGDEPWHNASVIAVPDDGDMAAQDFGITAASGSALSASPLPVRLPPTAWTGSAYVLAGLALAAASSIVRGRRRGVETFELSRSASPVPRAAARP